MQLDRRYHWNLLDYTHQERSPWFSTYLWGQDTELRQTLRDKTGLVLPESASEWEQILHLNAYVHSLSKHQGWDSADDLSALHLFDGVSQKAITFRCVEFAHMLQHVCAAFGFPARVIGLRRESSHIGLGKGHVVCDVWCNDLQKWVVLDPQLNIYYYLDVRATPLSALEIHDLVRSGRTTEIKMSRAEELQSEFTWPFPAKDNQAFEDIQVYEGFSREEVWESLQERGDFAGFLEYWLSYYYYLDYRQHYHSTRPKSKNLSGIDHSFSFYEAGTLPKVTFQKLRQAQVYTQDRTRIDLPLNGVEVQWIPVPADFNTPIEEARILTVHLRHSMPWFGEYQLTCNGMEMSTTDHSFTWPLQPGRNKLIVTPINDLGRSGTTATLEIEVLEE